MKNTHEQAREALISVIGGALGKGNVLDDIRSDDTNSTKLAELDLDSLDAVEMVMDLEDKLNVSISEEKAEEILAGKNTIGQVIDALCELEIVEEEKEKEEKNA